ncbi:MAG TPA: DUF5777 family beta-barrel protein [Thermoanaerobaculia bacterium]|nr:DUF5777 family beta-barrel protein [Thermoanaerobaculia bacterium]
MTERRLAAPILFACALLATPALAQNRYAPIPPLRLGESLLNLPTPRTIGHRSWEIRFTHRFSQPINEGDEHSLWGLDSSADIGIGLAWAATPHLQLSIFRTDLLDDFEIGAKYMIVEEAPAIPLSIAVRGGVDWRTEEHVERRTSWFAQAIVSKRIGRRVELFVVPSFVTDAQIDGNRAFERAFNLPVGIAWEIRPELSLIAELVPENSDLPDDLESSIAWAVGIKRAVGGHYFEVLLSNSRATHVDQYLTSTLLGTGLRSGDFHLGFNLERRFGGR